MIKSLTLSILLIANVSLANVTPQNETAPNTHSSLIESLLTGFDFTLDEALVTNSISEDLNASVFVNLELILTNPFGEQNKIVLYKSDDILNKGIGLLSLNKEIFVSGSQMFKALEPNINLINEATKIHLAVTLNKNNNDNILGRKLSQNEIALSSEALYQVNLNSQALVNDYGFKQNIDIPESFSHEDNAEITDLGFAIYFR